MPISTRLWPTFQQVVGRQKLMLRMMEAIGVNVPDAMRVDGGLAFLEAQAKCQFCGNEDSCPGGWTPVSSRASIPISALMRSSLMPTSTLISRGASRHPKPLHVCAPSAKHQWFATMLHWKVSNATNVRVVMRSLS